MPIDTAIVPGTTNTTAIDIVPADKIWLVPAGGYKPVYIGMEEGTPIQLELTPDQTADMSLDVVVSMSIDCVPVLASRMAVINA